jgi:hypothetical protein
MCRENSGHSHHEHHHHHGEKEPSPHHENDHAAGLSLSPSERLIIRLQHSIRHSREHAMTYRSMADEACEAGAEAAARWIRSAAEHSDRQTEDLENALKMLKNP